MNHQGALAKITKAISDTGANIHNLSTEKEGVIYLFNHVRWNLAKIMRRKAAPEWVRTTLACLTSIDWFHDGKLRNRTIKHGIIGLYHR